MIPLVLQYCLKPRNFENMHKFYRALPIFGYLFLSLASFAGHAQTGRPSGGRPARPQQVLPEKGGTAEFLRTMQKRMGLSEKMLDDMLRGGLFQDFEEKFEKMMEEVDKDLPEHFFKGESFGNVLRGFDLHRGLSSGDFRWMNTPKERVLIVKVGELKDNAVNIVIKNNSIKISGTITKKTQNKNAQGMNISRISASSFNKTFSVPSDCAGERAKIENKQGEILIRLPKKKIAKRQQLKRPAQKRPPAPAHKNDKVI